VSANCDRTSEALRDAVISRPRLSDHDSAIHPAQPNLDRHISKRVTSTTSRQNPRQSTNLVITVYRGAMTGSHPCRSVHRPSTGCAAG
jgi:hypothetical protein